MSDFNYNIVRTDHYSLVNAALYGESIQNGAPTPLEPVPIEVVEAPFLAVTVYKSGYSIGATGTESPLTGFNILSCNVSGRSSVYLSYTQVATNPVNNRFHAYDSNGTWLSQIDTMQTTKGTYETALTLPSGTAELRISTRDNTTINYVHVGSQEPAHVTSAGCIDFVVGDTATPIPLQGNVLASLPDSTKDVLTVDSTGAVTLEKHIGYIASYNGESVGNNYISTTGELSTGASVYYKLATSQTINLGTIDISNLQDIPEEIPISIVATLDPTTNYSYRNVPTYEILNPYEDYNAPEYAYPPNHFGQDWETFDANDWNVSKMLDYTGQPESHAVYTVELCELMQSGAFDWSRPELDWSEAAYDQEQFERFCKYFEARFMFREISMLPPLHWFNAFKRMMVYELMPKYKPLYAQVESGLAPLGENEYYKERHVSSAYPETLLSGNSDYISSGEDREWERVKVDNAAEALEAYRNGFRSVDAALGDELEVLFISMYTSFANAL